MKNIWTMFPFPTISEGIITDGSLMDRHPDCVKCPLRECIADRAIEQGEPALCRYGLTYARIDDDRVAIGVVAKDFPQFTPRARKRLKRERDRHVTLKQIRQSVTNVRGLGSGIIKDSVVLRHEAIASVKSDPVTMEAVANLLRADAENDLNQSHDLMQLVTLVQGYAESLLNEKLPEHSLTDAAESLETEGSIYFASQLMMMKIDSLMYLHEMNRAVGNEKTFKIHPLILKYKRIYDWRGRQKDLTISMGESHRSARYNADALGAVIQALLDNLIKYAPAGSKGHIGFSESANRLEVYFSSLGPLIEPDEFDNIFVPKVRGNAARLEGDSGQGIGLASAKSVSDALGLELTCTQSTDEDERFPGRFSTKFRFFLDTLEE